MKYLYSHEKVERLVMIQVIIENGCLRMECLQLIHGGCRPPRTSKVRLAQEVERAVIDPSGAISSRAASRRRLTRHKEILDRPIA